MNPRHRFFRAALALTATLLTAGAAAALIFIYKSGSAADRVLGTVAAVLVAACGVDPVLRRVF